ncbi:heme ABC transporter ATP-binding protein [Mangrovicella endophytica]|uniref:heme ABC transporter ATP-binding protein n=1 Tax=Mangrovicella endophytica TaxID=2066697 RepID=UPI000C9E1115|nr:heme ABC transporter ATP-binding protein [Mangrovicella endophytica]
MLSAHDVTVERGGRAVLSSFSIDIAPGEVVVLIGPNGAGKSTAFKALSGELREVAARVSLDGTPLASLSAAALARRRAVIPQATATAFAFTALEVARLGAEAGGARARDQNELAARALGTVGLAGFEARDVTEMSGGEAQRVHLARALAQLAAIAKRGTATAYLLMDEPTSSLDLQHQIAAMRLARTAADEGAGVLCILHDINLAAMAADRIVALVGGRIIADGRPSLVVTDDLIQRLYGTPISVRGIPAGDMPFILPQAAGAPSPEL